MIEEEVIRTPGLPEWVNFITQDSNGMKMLWQNKPYFNRDMRMWMDESEGKRSMLHLTPSIATVIERT